MGIEFRRVSFPPLHEFEAEAPAGAVIGLIGEEGSGAEELLQLAAGREALSGEVIAHGSRRLLGTEDALDFSATGVLLLHHALGKRDALARARAAVSLEVLRRAGTTILLLSHEEDLLLRLCDEVWWLREGRLAGRGDPAEVLSAYRHHVAQSFRASGDKHRVVVRPAWRRGDGRAEIQGIETIGELGQPTSVLRSGELAVLRIQVRFHDPIVDPVLGIMIRNRIGMSVYGTNTELEHVKIGPCQAGEKVCVSFAFRCELCPGEYSLTVASHDPDGVWHEWLEDAVAFSVTDSRYTAGVANLRAQVTLCSRG